MNILLSIIGIVLCNKYKSSFSKYIIYFFIINIVIEAYSIGIGFLFEKLLGYFDVRTVHYFYSIPTTLLIILGYLVMYKAIKKSNEVL